MDQPKPTRSRLISVLALMVDNFRKLAVGLIVGAVLVGPAQAQYSKITIPSGEHGTCVNVGQRSPNHWIFLTAAHVVGKSKVASVCFGGQCTLGHVISSVLNDDVDIAAVEVVHGADDAKAFWLAGENPAGGTPAILYGFPWGQRTKKHGRIFVPTMDRDHYTYPHYAWVFVGDNGTMPEPGDSGGPVFDESTMQVVGILWGKGGHCTDAPKIRAFLQQTVGWQPPVPQSQGSPIPPTFKTTPPTVPPPTVPPPPEQFEPPIVRPPAPVAPPKPRNELPSPIAKIEKAAEEIAGPSANVADKAAGAAAGTAWMTAWTFLAPFLGVGAPAALGIGIAGKLIANRLGPVVVHRIHDRIERRRGNDSSPSPAEPGPAVDDPPPREYTTTKNNYVGYPKRNLEAEALRTAIAKEVGIAQDENFARRMKRVEDMSVHILHGMQASGWKND